jgi:hypothetical protein
MQSTARATRPLRVPAMYGGSAVLAFLSVLALRGISKLQRINTGRCSGFHHVSNGEFRELQQRLLCAVRR